MRLSIRMPRPIESLGEVQMVLKYFEGYGRVQAFSIRRDPYTRIRERTIHLTYADEAPAAKVLQQPTHDIEVQRPGSWVRPEEGPAVLRNQGEAPSTRNRITVEVKQARESLKESIETRMKSTIKSNVLEHVRINKSMLRGFTGFTGELSKYWDNAATRNNAEILKILVQDKIRNERRSATDTRSVQTHAMHESLPTVIDVDAQPDDFRNLLDTVVSDESDSNTLVREPKQCLESIINESHESLEPTETVGGLLAKVGSYLERAILSDRLTQSANTRISLQSDVASTRNQLRIRKEFKDESLAQQPSQGDSGIDNSAAHQNDTVHPSSSPASTTENTSTIPSEASIETASPQTPPSSEISEMGEKDLHQESSGTNEIASTAGSPSELQSDTPRV